MKPTFDDCLRDLAERFEATQEQQNDAAWRAFTRGENEEDVFVAPPRRPAPPRVQWPDIAINDAQEDYELMLWDQFHDVSKLLAWGGSLIPCVRHEFGALLGELI
jgi:hypothetical protein